MNRLFKLTLFSMAAAFFALPSFAHDKLKTVVGGGPNVIPGLATNIPGISQIAADAEGNIYILSVGAYGSASVYKWSHGIVTLIAGDGTYFAAPDARPGNNFDGDSGPATKVELSGLNAIAVDNAVPANIFISNSTNCIIEKIDQTTGFISDVVNDPATGVGAGMMCEFYPQSMTIDPTNDDVYLQVPGNTITIYHAPQYLYSESTQIPSTYDYFCSNYPGENNPNCSSYPGFAYNNQAMVMDTSVTPGNLYIALPCAVDEVVGATGKLYTVAGSTTVCGNTDNVVATSGRFNNNVQVSVTGNGVTSTILVADQGNGSIRKFTVTNTGGVPQPGILTTVAGANGLSFCNFPTSIAVGACLYPGGVGGDALGNFFIADENYGFVDKVSAAGALTKVVGWMPTPNYAPLASNPEVLHGTRDVPLLSSPTAVFADPASPNVFVGGGVGNSVYVWNSATTKISDFAGNGVPGFAGDGGSAIAPGAELSLPSGMAKDSSGNIYIADTGNCRIRVVSASTGTLSTFAGGGSNPVAVCGFSGDGGLALDALFDHPTDVAFDAQGDLFVADEYNCAIRRIDASTHLIRTVAGGLPEAQCVNNGAFSGDGGLATLAQLWLPASVSFDGAGNLYVADSGNGAIREILAGSGIIQTVAGIGGNPGFNGDPGLNGDGRAVESQLNTPTWAKADPNGNLFIADSGNNVVRWVTPAGQMITFGGDPPPVFDDTFQRKGFGGDGILATDGTMNTPVSIDQDVEGNFYFVDQMNNRVRQVSAFPGYGLSTGSLDFGSQLANNVSATQTVTLSAIGPLKISVLALSHGFKETDNCAHTELGAGQTCQIQVSFDPKTAGSMSGVLKIYSNALLKGDNGGGEYDGNPDTVLLSGSGHN